MRASSDSCNNAAPWQDILDLAYYSGWRKQEILGLTWDEIDEAGGVRHSVFNSYPLKVDTYNTVFTPEARSYWFKLDGQNLYENPQGPNGRGQTVGMWLIDLNTIFRERMTKGVIDERVLYRVSPDGQTLTWTGFNSERDSGHVVWDRISLP